MTNFITSTTLWCVLCTSLPSSRHFMMAVFVATVDTYVWWSLGSRCLCIFCYHSWWWINCGGLTQDRTEVTEEYLRCFRISPVVIGFHSIKPAASTLPYAIVWLPIVALTTAYFRKEVASIWNDEKNGPLTFSGIVLTDEANVLTRWFSDKRELWRSINASRGSGTVIPSLCEQKLENTASNLASNPLIDSLSTRRAEILAKESAYTEHTTESGSWRWTAVRIACAPCYVMITDLGISRAQCRDLAVSCEQCIVPPSLWPIASGVLHFEHVTKIVPTLHCIGILFFGPAPISSGPNV